MDRLVVAGGQHRRRALARDHQGRTALHTLLKAAARPPFLDDRDDVWVVGDRAAWEEQPLVIQHAALRGLAREFAAHLRPCAEPVQLVHGDLTGNVLIAEGLPPAVIDMSCYWRPPTRALAVVVADALAWPGTVPGQMSWR